MGHPNTGRALALGHHRVYKSPLKSKVTPPRPPVSTSHLLRGQTPGSGVRHRTSPVGLSRWVPKEPHEDCRSGPLSHHLDGETEARWPAELSWNRSVPGPGPSLGTFLRTGRPARRALRMPELRAQWQRRSVASPSLTPHKGRVLRHPEAHGVSPSAVAVLFALAPSPGRALAVPCGYVLTRKLTRERESPGRPPGRRGPCGRVPHREQGSGTHTLGVLAAAPPRPPRVTTRFLVSARLAADTVCPFTGLFTGSLPCT